MSHHPPAAAHHVISERGWNLRQEITVASKFRGKYLSIMPLGKSEISGFRSCKHQKNISNWSEMLWFAMVTGLMWYSLHDPFLFPFSPLFIVPFLPGTIHAIFEKSNNHYTWKKVTTTVHNIIVGKLWIDQVRPEWSNRPSFHWKCLHSCSFFCLSPVRGDRRGESHYRRPLPLEVCTLQLLLQRCGQEGEEPYFFF